MPVSTFVGLAPSPSPDPPSFPARSEEGRGFLPRGGPEARAPRKFYSCGQTLFCRVAGRRPAHPGSFTPVVKPSFAAWRAGGPRTQEVLLLWSNPFLPRSGPEARAPRKFYSCGQTLFCRVAGRRPAHPGSFTPVVKPSFAAWRAGGPRTQEVFTIIIS
jgi:hypothetical protein